MAKRSNSDNNELNNAVEQVVTEDNSPSSATLSGNQNNQQSTAANTVATGSDSIAPLMAENHVNSEEGRQNAAQKTDENSKEGKSEQASNNNQNKQEDDTLLSNVIESDGHGDETKAEEGAQSARSDTQEVGGTNASERAQENAPSNDQSVAASSESMTQREETNQEVSSSDEKIDKNAFEVNVGGGDRSIYSNELEHSDTIENTTTFEVNVSPANDAPTAVDKSFILQEDGTITFTAEELLVGAQDIDGDKLYVESVNYEGTEGILLINNNGNYSFAPNDDFNGHIDLSFTVSDGEASVLANIGLNIEGVEDAPVAGSTSYQVDEDSVLTFNDAQLLANSSDVEGDVFVQSIFYSGSDGELKEHGDGTYSFIPNENYHGNLAFDVVVVDEAGLISSTTASVEVTPVNDAVIAEDDSELTDGSAFIRLDLEPEHGTVQYLDENNEWTEMKEGELCSSDTELQFVADVDDVQSSTRDIQLGSFDSNTDTTVFDGTAKASDWGTVDGNKAVFTQDGVTITTEVNNGELTAWNGSGTSVGAGIGDQHRNGLTDDDTLTVTVEGEDINQITFQLDGLGGWFDESHSKATEVVITAYDADGNVIDSQGGFRESGEYQDTYSFTTDQPVHHFELGTSGGGGSYVVQNMTLSRTLSEEISVTTIQTDGTETECSVSLDLTHNGADEAINVTEELIAVDHNITTSPIQVLEDGQLTLNPEDILHNDIDLDGDELALVEVHVTDSTHGDVELTDDGQIIYTPTPDYSGTATFEYTVTDNNGSFDTAMVTVEVIPQQDGPIVSGNTKADTDEDNAITITQKQLLANAKDVDGDPLSAVNLSADNADIVANEDGSYIITPDADFNGLIDVTYDINDGSSTVASNLSLTVNPVNDAPVVEHVTYHIDEDGMITLSQSQLLANSADIDNDELVASNLNVAENATVITNDDGSFSIKPNDDFSGNLTLSFDVSDGNETVQGDLLLTVNPVNDKATVEDQQFVMNEDGSLLISDEQLLSGAKDLDDTDKLTVESVGYEGGDGTLMPNGNGTYTFTPNENFSGNVELNFSVTDGSESTPAIINIDVNAVADSPELTVDHEVSEENDNLINVDIGAALGDQDLSEVLTVTLDGAPEGSVIHYDGDAVINDQDNGLTIYSDTTVTVTFEGEGAGYQNSAGYYIVEEDGTISGVQLIYDNASQQGSGGDLIPGQSSFSFDIEEGQSFNLFVVPNGFNHNQFNEMQNGTFVFRDENGDSATMDSIDPQLIFINEDGIETLIRSQNGDTVYHGGNSVNLNQDGVEHTKTTMNEQGELVYGIEDLYGGGDRDYDDFTFTIDLGEVNQAIYSGEIIVSGDQPVIIPTVILDQTLGLELPEGTNDSFDLTIEATSTEESNQDSSSTTQVIHIDAVNYAPEVAPIATNVDEDNAITLTQEELLASASDANGDALVATNLSVNSEAATITANDNGSYTVTPTPDFHGDLNITYEVTDGEHIVPTELQLTVNAINDAPTAPTLSVTETEDSVIIIDPSYILDQVSDVDGDTPSLETLSVRSPANATLTQNQDGTYQVVVPEHFTGSIDIAYTVSDGATETEGTVNLNITPVDDAPFQTTNAHLATDEDGSITFNGSDLVDLFDDVDSSVTISKVVTAEGEEAEGTVVDNGDGTWTFTPTDDFAGTTGLNVVATDGTTEVSMDMNVYIRPIADGVTITTSFDGPLVFAEDERGHFGLDIEQLDTSEVMTSVMMTGYPVGFVVSDGTHSVTITEENQGVDVTGWNLDDMTMESPDDYSGNFFVTVSVVSLDQVEDPADNPITQELGTQSQDNEGFVLDEDDSVLLLADELLESVDSQAEGISEVTYSGEEGTLIDNENDSWTFWANPEHSDNIGIEFATTDGEQHQVSLVSAQPQHESNTEENQDKQPELITINDSSINEDQLSVDMEEGADYTSAPGELVSIHIPEEISESESLDHIDVQGIPEGVYIENGLEQSDGNYVVSDTEASLHLGSLPDFSGEIELTMVGMTDMDQPIEGAAAEVSIEIDDQYDMEGSSASSATNDINMDNENTGDWTTVDNTEVGVDVMDDSSSFEHQSTDSATDDDVIVNNDF